MAHLDADRYYEIPFLDRLEFDMWLANEHLTEAQIFDMEFDEGSVIVQRWQHSIADGIAVLDKYRPFEFWVVERLIPKQPPPESIRQWLEPS